MRIMKCYIDGSYREKYPNKVGSAIIIVNEDETIEEIFFSKYDEELAKQRNVGGELRSCMMALKIAVERNYEEIHIYYDYIGIEKWCTKEWKAKNKYTQAYRDYYDEMSKMINVKFFKCDAHSGDYYNELADYYAKKSLEG